MSKDVSPSPRPKRQMVKAASQSCQKRKVKCSGERPMCMLCHQGCQPCVYDSDAGISRVEAVRRRSKELGERNSDFELVFHALHGTPDNQAFGHLRRLRECPDVESYARTLRKARLTTRNRPSDQLNDLMEYGAMFNLFPMSTQPQDQQDDNQNMFLDPVPTTDYTSPSRQPTFMIDPRLSQKTLYNSSGQRWFDSTEPAHFHDWAKPDGQAEPSRN
ncbi:hypothetical protein E4T45_03630 [Aureobasidium sp. EXF-8846]|nr:hypothetical protein E4T45_03630 [Aureobasidium sp. EXF-8846]